MDTVVILDFGSQFTQLITRRVRENQIYAEVFPADISMEKLEAIAPKAIILSGSPHSTLDEKAPVADRKIFKMGIPVLGLCYGMQWMASVFEGKVEESATCEYGPMGVEIKRASSRLFQDIPKSIKTWMSHGNEVKALPKDFLDTAYSLDGSLAAMEHKELPFYALQFHPEVTHTEKGMELIRNFLSLTNIEKKWNMKNFIVEKEKEITEQIGKEEQVICALSGGVDSTVAAVLVEQAIPGRLSCLYVDNGLQRKNERQDVEALLSKIKLSVEYIDASDRFLDALKGVQDPEEKRKIIGKTFIAVFEEESKRISKEKKRKINWMLQGTLYPDVIESVPPPGRGNFSATIKSHHNVGGLPEKMDFKLLEPFRELFKDEVRALGKELGIPEENLLRHPFPGPGLAVRCLGDIRKDRLAILQEADAVFIKFLRDKGLYKKIWQAGAILLPVSTVGVMGDQRSYEYPIVLRAVISNDGMTASWYPFSTEELKEVSARIINEVRGVNRVVYDVSNKPPATIEWE